MNLEKVINQASNILKKNNINSHELDAQIILSDILGVTKEFLLINDNLVLSIFILVCLPHSNK